MGGLNPIRTPSSAHVVRTGSDAISSGLSLPEADMLLRFRTTRGTRMAAIGCLLPFMLLALGAIVGGVVGGVTMGLWCGAAGLAVGIVLMLVALRAFDRARDNLPE
jgi:hypothetical protein